MQQQYTVWRIIHPNSSSTCGLVASQKDSMQKIYTFPLCRASAFLFCNSPFTNGPTTRRSRNLRACDKSAAAFFRSSADGSCKHGNPGGWKHWLQSYSISTPSRNTRLNKSFARLGLTLLSISWNIFCTLKLILKHFGMRLTTWNSHTFPITAPCLIPAFWDFSARIFSKEPSSAASHNIRSAEASSVSHLQLGQATVLWILLHQFNVSFLATRPILPQPPHLRSFKLSPLTRTRFFIVAVLHSKQEPWKHPKMKTDFD